MISKSRKLLHEIGPHHLQQVLLRGLRCRIGIFRGAVDRVTPHVKSGRADYFGQPVNRAARLMSAAHGGQVIGITRIQMRILR